MHINYFLFLWTNGVTSLWMTEHGPRFQGPTTPTNNKIFITSWVVSLSEPAAEGKKTSTENTDQSGQ